MELICKAAVTAASTVGVVVVVSVDVSVDVVVESSDDPQAANDRAMRETPLLALLSHFSFPNSCELSTRVVCLLERPFQFEMHCQIIFMFFAPYKY